MRNFILMMILSLSLQARSQEFESLVKVIPTSPTSMLFQRYGDYPVSHYTGIPDIRIPIYTIENGDITVPIYLSYHGSGTRYDDLGKKNSGFIGLGWTLQAGGMITRTVNGVEDWKGNEINMDGFPNFQYNYSPMLDIDQGFTDHQYDLFTYNFLGRSGQYLDYNTIDPGYRPFLFKYEPLKFSDFHTIIDEEGKQFYFNEEEWQESMVGPMSYSTPSTWHLSGIISGKYPGVDVSFTYQEASQRSQKSNSMFILDEWKAENIWVNGYEVLNFNQLFTYSLANTNNVRTSTYIRKSNPKFVKRISFTKGYILFHMDINKDYLERIEIFDMNNVLLKTITLQRGTFGDGETPRLQSVTFKSQDLTPVEVYNLQYTNENSSHGKGRDHWGFYNDRGDGGGSFLPPFHGSFYQGLMYVTRNIGGTADKTVSEYATKLYTLSQITYPTKGFTQFEFEGNRAYDETMPIGGLRIKSISNYTSAGLFSSKKSYVYKSAQPEVNPIIDLYLKESSLIVGDGHEPYYDGIRTTVYEHPLLNMSPKGAPIGYYHVIETENDRHTNYIFDNENAYEYDRLDYPGYRHNNFQDYTPFAHYYRPWVFGNLVSKTTRAPGFEESVYNVYEDVVLDTIHDLAFERTVNRYCGETVGSYFLTDCGSSTESNAIHFNPLIRGEASVFNYKQRQHLSGLRRLKSTSTTLKNNDGSTVSKEISFQYNQTYPTQITAEIETDSKGLQKEVQMIYPTDSLNQPYYSDLFANNILSWVKRTVKINSLTKESTYIKFKNYGDAFYPSYAPFFIEKRFNSGAVSFINFLARDVFGNPLHIKKNTERDVVYLWGYRNQYPIAQIENATYAQVEIMLTKATIDALNLPLVSDTAIEIAMNKLRTGLPQAMVTSYTYRPLVGMTSMTDPRGIKVTYRYDGMQRLQTVLDHLSQINRSFDYHYRSN